jgi:two-component system, NtrC family, nitrogen regulation sensor histidine kinase GlnL
MNPMELQRLKANAFESAPGPAVLLDAAGRVLAMNEAAETMFGQGLAQVSRGQLLDALSPGSELPELAKACREQRRVIRRDPVDITIIGQPKRLASVMVSPVDEAVLVSFDSGPSAQGGRADPSSLLSVVGLGQMLAHEVKNPLAGIRGAAQLLRGAAASEDIPLAQLIVDETDRIRRLIDRMEAFAEPTTPHLAPVNLHEVLDRVIALIGNGVAEGLVLKANYDPSLPMAWADQDQLIQVFLNLAKNAAEACHTRPDGRGEISISTAYRHGVWLRSDSAKPALTTPLEVRVVDNGPGVPERLRERLFEPFVTTKGQGAGLGLSLAAKIVTAHGGLLDFESEPGRTAFRVLLPMVQAD